MTRMLRACAAACFVLFTLSPTAPAQGPLTPGAGPAPVMKTLDQVEPGTPIGAAPVTISSPGSYYLTGDLVVSQAFSSGIRVQASHVDIDLNGFSLISAISNSLDGIYLFPGYRDCRVHNGNIVGWNQSGYYGIYADGPGLTVEDVTIEACNSGIRGSSNLVVRNSLLTRLASDGSGFGIETLYAALVESCQITDSSMNDDFDVVKLGQGSIIRNTTVRNNRAGGVLYGVLLNRGSVADGVTVADNHADLICYGYSLSAGCIVTESTALSNSGGLDARGFRLTGAMAKNCTASRQYGIRSAIGIEALSGSEVAGCLAAQNGFALTNGIGFRTLSSTLRDSTTSDNTLYGVELFGESVALNNTIRGHNGSGDSGIYMEGYNSLIEGNTFIDNSDGINFQNSITASNLVIRNRFFQSSPQVPGNNAYGIMYTASNGYINATASEHPLSNLRF